MADNEVKEAEASMANLLLDEVTGEKVSKTELKKRQKQREKDAKKKEKEVAAPPKTQKKVSAEEEEANLSPNVSVPGFGLCGGGGGFSSEETRANKCDESIAIF